MAGCYIRHRDHFSTYLVYNGTIIRTGPLPGEEESVVNRSARLTVALAALVVFCIAAPATPAPNRPDNPLAVEGPVAPAYALKAAVPTMAAQPYDREALRVEDLDREEQGLPPRFALPEEVFITPATDGVWQELDRNFDIWRLRVHSPGSLSLNFGFGAYRLP